MEILTTRDLRKFLAEVMVDVRTGTVEPVQAQAIAKLSAQINQSLALEINASFRKGVEKADFVDVEPLKIASEAAEDGKVWCDQCDDRIAVAEAAGCKSPHCSFRKSA